MPVFSLSEVKVVVIDELSMISNDILLYIHLLLVEIFVCPNNTPFAGITVIVVGHFLQQPPVWARPVYGEYNNNLQNLHSL